MKCIISHLISRVKVKLIVEDHQELEKVKQELQNAGISIENMGFFVIPHVGSKHTLT
jgi:hypothetical protein